MRRDDVGLVVDDAQGIVEHRQRASRFAARKRIALPNKPDAAQHTLIQNVGALHGGSFDSSYVQAVDKAHRDDVALFESAKAGSDPEIAAFAAKRLAAIQKHQQMLTSLEAGGRSTGAAQ